MPDLSFETRLKREGYTLIAGVDEVGRGPLAGPVVAAAVILPQDKKSLAILAALNDSKKLSPAARDRLFPLIQAHALDYGLGVVSAPTIDRINILQATYLAMFRALGCLQRADYVLIDGNRRLPHWEGPQETIIKGDSRSLSIAAASVLAKVARDRLMEALGSHYPGYGLERHMGYGTAEHQRQILALGLSPQHRRSFCRKLLEAV